MSGDDDGLRPFTVRDLFSFRVVRDLDLSPDGQWLAYEVEEVDEEGDQYFSNLWIVATAGGAPRQLTFGKRMNSSPRFSPTGSRIAFLSNREPGPSQLCILSLDGGEARSITHLPGGAGPAAWSPDGERLAFAAVAAAERTPHQPRVIRRLGYKVDGLGITADEPTQVFVVDAGGGDADAVTEGDGSASSPAWSPDGASLAFSRRRAGPRDGHRSDIWTLELGSGRLRQLTDGCAHALSPSWSPDGRTVAFYATEQEGDARQQLWLADVEDGRARRLTSEGQDIASFPLGRTAAPLWDEGGTEIAVLLVTATSSGIALVSPRHGGVRQVLSGERQLTMLTGSARARRFCFAWSDPRVCGHVSTAGWDGGGERLLVDVNDGWAAGRDWPRASMRAFPTPASGPLEGLFMRPRTAAPWPLLVDVHGGPLSYVEFGFPYHPYWYELTSRGWAVLSLNPVGSSSYGAEHAERLRGRWGEADLPQHLAAVDSLVAEGLVDDQRVAIAGKSYGGYMAAWAIGKTRRFRAAVFSAGVTNLESHFGTSDSGYYVDPYDMGGELFEQRARYQHLSPVHAAHQSVTPLLILQGEDDQRCPIGQAEELFAVLMRAGRSEVEFVRYPGGTHRLAETGRPSHRLDYHGRIVDFVTRHTS